MPIIHILSSQSSLKFARKGKIQGLSDFLDEYKKVCSFFVEELWSLNLKDVPSLSLLGMIFYPKCNYAISVHGGILAETIKAVNRKNNFKISIDSLYSFWHTIHLQDA